MTLFTVDKSNYYIYPVKKLFSISISFVLLMQSLGVQFSDIYQLDELIEHAKFHSDEYGDSFFVFISKHYGELKKEHEKKHQDEKSQHEQLPFQQQSPSVLVFVASLHKVEFESVDFPEFNASNFHYKSLYSSANLEGILQPPRLS